MTTPITDKRQVRQALFQQLRARLVGPLGGDFETISTGAPSEMYTTGALYPQETPVGAAEDDTAEEVDDDRGESIDSADQQAAVASAFKPSVAGLTCVVDAAHARLTADLSYGRYKSRKQDYTGRDGQVRQRNAYDRTAHGYPGVEIDAARSGSIDLDGGRARLAWTSRRPRAAAGNIVLTVTVANQVRGEGEEARMPTEATMFQVALALRGAARPFLPRLGIDEPQDQDDARMHVLYRNRPAFGRGHGCAAIWGGTEAGRAAWVATEFLPAYEVPHVQALGQALSMDDMAEKPWPSTKTAIEGLLASYDSWVEHQQQACRGLPSAMATPASQNISDCRAAAARARDGLAVIDSSPTARRAFTLMCKAMAQARRIQDPGRSRPTWFPFQIVFILQALKGASSQDTEAEPAHVLWFPTGGGKTEAYLGLAAFVILLRRLGGYGKEGTYGTAVIMRYTLRLLTVQQFQRAATLVCALELLRRDAPNALGQDPVSVGLWVGGGSTPNTIDQADKALRYGGGASPVQLRKCPWCSEPLPESAYSIARDRQSVLITCPGAACPFRQGIPAYVVDEEIYRRCPTIIIGTVDKFARLPWDPRTKALFGFMQAWCPRHGHVESAPCPIGRAACGAKELPGGSRPPSLIIQDELHLISGPLGTMVGVYEALIDYVCRARGRMPLVIGSSATVRRSSEQVRSLYGRPIAVFPPRALDDVDTFFSSAIPLEQRPGRLYVGYMPAGTSMKTGAIRVLGSLLHDLEFMPGLPGLDEEQGRSLRDPYWTIISYYNSLRELGGAIRLAEDDIPSHTYGLRERGASRRAKPSFEELTSRKAGPQVPRVLESLEQGLDRTERPLDLVFSTNMFSVGVDVQRLGAMMVTGQPKATAEYIQATSRVGRRDPGIVVCVYNFARPRDRSHYEDFTDYHATTYRHVEVNSVTPHTRPALRKGLHAVIVAAVRYLAPDMQAEDRAARFDASLVPADLLPFLRQRLGDPAGGRESGAEVEAAFRIAVDAWAELARRRRTLVYSWPDDRPRLLLPFEEQGAGSEGLPTLNSLRDVEPNTGVDLVA